MSLSDINKYKDLFCESKEAQSYSDVQFALDG